jgi:hypothetical protein
MCGGPNCAAFLACASSGALYYHGYHLFLEKSEIVNFVPKLYHNNKLVSIT